MIKIIIKLQFFIYLEFLKIIINDILEEINER
jgi:hypothetical protein